MQTTRTKTAPRVVWYKAVKRTENPGVFRSIYGKVLWRVGETNTLEGADGADEPVLCERGFHACRNPAAPFLTFLGYGYIRKTDTLLEVVLGGKVVSDGLKCAGTSCTPLRVVPAEEWGELVRSPVVLVNTATGTEYHVKNGVLHREGDEPAIVYADGRQEWYKNGVLHREGDAPAVIWADGNQEWYKYGKVHREGDKPASITTDGSQEWHKDGVRHRDGDAPAIITAGGRQVWYRNGKLHRDGDKPAIVDDGRQEWYGFSRETDALLEVALGGKIVSDGIKCAGTSCTPLRVIPAEEWGELMRTPAVVVNTATGTKYHVKDGVLHREGDEPAIVFADGSQEWHRNGVLHREGDAPAVILADGRQEWYRNGKLHRDGDKPAVVYPSGRQEWYKYGVVHRDGEKPAVIWTSGRQDWYKDGKLHRDGDAPARIWTDGRQEWYKNGKLHRDGDAPAVIWADGRQAWYKDGVRIRIESLGV